MGAKSSAQRPLSTEWNTTGRPLSDSSGTTSSSRPPSLDFSSKRASVASSDKRSSVASDPRHSTDGGCIALSAASMPLSPTGYQQPPTPDHPPPSPMTAVLGIQEKINPMDKRRSRDMETITESEFLQSQASSADTPPGGVTPAQGVPCQHGSLGGSTEGAVPGQSPGGSAVLRKKTRDSSEQTTAGSCDDSGIEIVNNGNNPFLVDNNCPHCLTKGAIPKGQRRIKSAFYDSLPANLSRRSKRISAPGVYPGSMDPEGARGGVQGGHNQRVSLYRRSLVQGGEHGGEMDETEEWAQIADILSSCGGRMSTSEYMSDYGDFERRLQKIFSEEKGRARVQSVGDWLESLGMAHCENLLVANGYDDMDFMGPDVLDDTDLMELGITDSSHRQCILNASTKLTNVKPIVGGTPPASVEDWLTSLHLAEYLDTFLVNDYSSMDRVRNIWELELNTVLEVSTLGHRKRILASLRVPPEADTVSQSDDFLDFTKEWCTRENQDLCLYRDYTNVRPRSRHRDQPRQESVRRDSAQGEGPCDLCEQEAANGSLPQGIDPSGVQIRPPHTTTDNNSTIKQWRHQPEVLIRGCCNYTVQYLGSTLVKSLQGTESTRESIHKMKKSTDSIAKVPSVVLSVSYKGVKFIDARSKHVICEHDISNIFCACQDGENLNYFAYITRDHVTERHYCHVFCVRSLELATEIILTLGEAFEVAYQVAIRERVIAEETEEGDGSCQGQTSLPRSQEGRGTIPRSQEGHGTNSRSQEGRGTIPRSQEGQGTNSRSQEGRGTIPRSQEGQGTNSRSQEGRETIPRSQEESLRSQEGAMAMASGGS